MPLGISFLTEDQPLSGAQSPLLPWKGFAATKALETVLPLVVLLGLLPCKPFLCWQTSLNYFIFSVFFFYPRDPEVVLK